MAQQIGEADAGAGNVADRRLVACGQRGAHEKAQIVIARAGIMLGGDIGADEETEAVVGQPFQGEAAGQFLRALGRLAVGKSGGRIGEVDCAI